MPPDSRSSGRAVGLSGLLGRIVAGLLTAAVLVLGLMFSVVVLVVALVGGAAFFGWLWWKMRRVLRQAQQDPRFEELRARTSADSNSTPSGGNVIEGEVIHGEWKNDQDGHDRHD